MTLIKNYFLVKTNLLIVVFFFINNLIFSQNYQNPSQYSKAKYENIQFFPVGWSEDSNFAYFVERPGSMRGSYNEFVIQNVKSDKILVSIEDVDFEINSEIRYQLRKYNIIPQYCCYDFEDISTRSGKDFKLSYRILEDEIEEWASGDYYNEKVGFRIKVYNRYGSKTITRFKGNDKIDNVRFIGSIKSPYENRIVIITAYSVYDYQGDYDNENIYVSGCSLKSGFK